MGSFLNKVKLKNDPYTKVMGSDTNSYYSAKRLSNGFGQSFIIPNGLVTITQSYKVSKGGTVKASYQHATKSISLANSKNYTLSSSGYGGVFNFGTVGASTYDKMGGVSISV